MRGARKKTFDELYAEIAALPEGITGEIIEPGVLETMSRPAAAHRRAHRQLFRALETVNAESKGKDWWIELDAEIEFPGGRLLVPDVSAWRTSRVARMPNENPIPILPDFACEILSPSTERTDRGRKLPLFAKSAVEWTWIVDPEARLVEVFRAIGERPTLVASAIEVGEAKLPPFDIPIAIGSLWMPP